MVITSSLEGTHVKNRLIAVIITLGAVFGLAACGGSDPAPAGTNSGSSERPNIVASTSMWGAVASAIAGDHASVKAIIDNPNQDPHDYEATAQDKLAFDKASVVLVNGGGYDDWATTTAKSVNASDKLMDAVQVAKLPGTGTEGFNEHLWYSLTGVKSVAAELSARLSKLDAAHASDYAANLKTFTGELDKLIARGAAIGKAHSTSGYVSTEPVAVHLLDDMGLKDQTPEAFTEQSEGDAGVSVAVLNQTLTLVKSGKLGFLAVNPQTEDATSKQLIAAAEQAKTPTVEVYETLPEGVTSYQGFISSQLDAIQKALG